MESVRESCHEAWRQLMRRLRASSWEQECFRELSLRYEARSRHYHNLQHILLCVQAIERHRDLAVHPDSVMMALFFHDAIYDVRRTDNEERSAELALNYCQSLGLDPAFAHEVAELILATRHRDLPPSPDAALTVDIDLLILAAPAEEFARYEQGVRQEYILFNDVDFWLGRARYLANFLERPWIYHNEALRSLHEDKARANLKASIRNSRLRGVQAQNAPGAHSATMIGEYWGICAKLGQDRRWRQFTFLPVPVPLACLCVEADKREELRHVCVIASMGNSFYLGYELQGADYHPRLVDAREHLHVIGCTTLTEGMDIAAALVEQLRYAKDDWEGRSSLDQTQS